MWFGDRVNRGRGRVVVLWTALLCWAVAILWLSSLRPDELPDAAFVFWDKFNHFLAFTLGGWLAAGALRASNPSRDRTRAVIWAVVLIALFGLLDESLQTLTPGRHGGDADDWIADVCGALVGALLSAGVDRLGCRRTSKESQ